MFRRSLLAFLMVSGLCLLNGCATVIYQELNSDLSGHAAIDENDPVKTTLWSYAWGNVYTEWTPHSHGIGRPLCYNKGAGRVEVRYKWYSALLMVATLGIAVPMEMRVYCYVDSRVAAADAASDSTHVGP